MEGKLLSELREAGQITTEDYRSLYKRVKGGFFRNKTHLMYFIKERDMLKKGISKKQAMERLRKAPGKAARKKAAAKKSIKKTKPVTKKPAKKTKKK